MTNKPKAVIYIRVSDESQIDNNSLKTQDTACKNLIKNRGYELCIPPFREEGVSAKHVATRPALQELLQYCVNKKNGVNFVVVYKLDRWSRNTQEGLAAEALLSKYGIELISVTENLTKDPTGTFLKTLFFSAAQWDNEMKGLRVSDNQKTMFKDGYWCWKPPIGYHRPYGSKEDRKRKVSVIDENLGLIIKELFIRAADGLGNKQKLANEINLLGFEKYHGKKADCNLVSKIASKTFYYGMMYAPKWDLYQKGKHDPIIDEPTWQKANKNLFGRKARYYKDVSAFPLKGSLHCFTCGNPLTTSNPKGNGGQYLYYECKNKKCTKNQRIMANLAHEKIIGILKDIKPKKEVQILFENMIFNEWDHITDRGKKQMEFFDKRMEELNKNITQIIESNQRGILNDDEAKERVEKNRIEITTIKIEKSDIVIEEYNTEIVRNFISFFLENLDRLWNHLDLTKRQAFISKMFPDGLVCENHDIRTKTLSPSFELIYRLNTENSPLVTLRGIEPRLAE